LRRRHRTRKASDFGLQAFGLNARKKRGPLSEKEAALSFFWAKTEAPFKRL